MNKEKPYIYLAGDIMSAGSNLARQKEYDSFKHAGIDAEVYSPVMNKSINDKSNVTEEENNRLAEKITEQDIDRLYKADIVVMNPEQYAVGSLCEMGCLYGWKYLGELIKKTIDAISDSIDKDQPGKDMMAEFEHKLASAFIKLMYKLNDKRIFAHYFDIRTNHLNEKDWRRSFSINQLLYGMILYATDDHMLNNSFEDVLPKLKAACDKMRGCNEDADE